MSPTPAEVVQAYRHVYKHVLRAVQYSKPARFVARDRVRDGFRKKSAADYDAARITRTLEFLDGAAEIRGLEHRIVKNLMHVWWEQKQLRTTQLPIQRREFQKVAYDDFNHTIRMLEESMGMCLR
ncbi:hypothetical protein LTR37_017893 [Vermiconidia calcicola]|uniref:Uncharacterized protein n=1 Tax=Vermiconidia calcicola TaxID=1690605 RepID=A0ACC3MJJ4_9PEZI|nr:hypothetical protein LTR37_017893 [Vermiconidia calcicola]